MNSAEKSGISQRKDDHLKICIEEDVTYDNITTGFEIVHLMIDSLIRVKDFDEIDLSTEFLGKKIDYPILVSGMTGGSKLGQKYNKIIAEVCQEKNIAMGVGSQRAAIEQPSLAETFQVRDIAPDIPLLANLGIAQFIDNYSVKEAKQAIEMIDADALAVHINPLQELIQKEGDRKLSKTFEALQNLSETLKHPLIIKGVGTGFSSMDMLLLHKLKFYALDIAGAGGTNWKKIEAIRNPNLNYLSKPFLEIGIPTLKSFKEALNYLNLGTPSFRNLFRLARRPHSDLKKLIVSGGIWSGIDAVKALLSHGHLVAFAYPALRAVAKGGKEELKSFLDSYIFEMKTVLSILNLDNLGEIRSKGHRSVWIDPKAYRKLETIQSIVSKK
jgi:isopentenyl-diphosphate delta-isomerase